MSDDIVVTWEPTLLEEEGSHVLNCCFFLCQKWCVIWSEGRVATSDHLGFWGLFLASSTLNVNQHQVKTDRGLPTRLRGRNITKPFAFYCFVILFLGDIFRNLSPWETCVFDMSSLWTGVSWCSAFCFHYIEPAQRSQNRLWKSCLWLGRTLVLTLKQMWYLHKGPSASMGRIK